MMVVAVCMDAYMARRVLRGRMRLGSGGGGAAAAATSAEAPFKVATALATVLGLIAGTLM